MKLKLSDSPVTNIMTGVGALFLVYTVWYLSKSKTVSVPASEGTPSTNKTIVLTPGNMSGLTLIADENTFLQIHAPINGWLYTITATDSRLLGQTVGPTVVPLGNIKSGLNAIGWNFKPLYKGMEGNLVIDWYDTNGVMQRSVLPLRLI